MKKLIFCTLLAISLAFAFNSCNSSTPSSMPVESKTTEAEVYTCPMHPEIQRDKTGDCPKCGMKLVLMDSSDTSHMHNLPDTANMMN